MLLILVSLALGNVFYRQLSNSIHNNLKAEAKLITIGNSAEVIGILSKQRGINIRINVIEKNGEVIYDSTGKVLKNHADREEVINALKNGEGFSKRLSNTLGEENYYYAVRLNDGNVLRLSQTTRSIWLIFKSVIPIVSEVLLVAVVLSYLLASILTGRIVAPINNVDLGGKISVPYDELSPFAKAISNQRNEIEKHIDELNERTQTIETIMDSMREGIIIVDDKALILSVNKSATEIFGIKNAVGKSIFEEFRDIEIIQKVNDALNKIRGELDIENEGRSYRVLFSPVENRGFIMLFLDITEKANVEKLRREFSANVSHELKTPLTTIYGNVEMLNNKIVKQGDEKVFYDKIQNEASRLINLIEDIIKISNLDEVGSIEKTAENVYIKNMVDEIILGLEQNISEKNITVEIDISDNEIVKVNQTHIYELLFNLIENAVKYNKSNGEIFIKTQSDEENIKISVQDTGIGIPKEEQNRVFERFYRVDKSRSKATGGSGLGLAIVKHIVMIYNGEIELKSEENQGTKIEVTFSKKQLSN